MPILSTTEKTNYDKVVNEAVRKKEKAAGTDVTTGTNNTKYNLPPFSRTHVSHN